MNERELNNLINNAVGTDAQWKMRYENQLLANLYAAHLEARKGGKRSTFDEHKFEINEFENLINLRDTILDGTYRPSRGTAHIIHNPVIREIFAASYRDRVVHHFMYDKVSDPWWDKHFIYDSYSCRKDKGTLEGAKRLAHYMQSVSENYSRKTWVIKLDIQGYFMSLPREQLYQRAIWGLDRQYKENKIGTRDYEVMKFLWAQTIFDDPCRGVKRKGWPEDWKDLPDSKSLFKQPEGVGIVIGNLTSQLLSNIYLDQLDRYVVYDLGWKAYGRYVDDFYIVVTEEDLPRALKDVEAIRRFLRHIGLTLHPNKMYVQPIERGVAFLGYVIYPGRKYPGKRIIRNAKAAFDEVVEGVRDVESVVSYMGHMKHTKSDKILAELFERVGWELKL